MVQRLDLVAVLVPSYDEGIAHYCGDLGFDLLEDTDRGGGKRWVRVAPPGSTGSSLLLAQAVGDRQVAAVGEQFGGRVGLFLSTDDFARDHQRYLSAGVTFEEEPRHEEYGTVAVFRDRFGTRWDLIQPA